ncbi:MAG: nucleoside diphosphate kinase regulator, partial [Devosia sp.]
MPSMTSLNLRPELVLGEADHRKLVALALAGIGHSSEAGDDLLYELERAQVVSDEALPAAVVHMGSRVTYRPDNGDARTVTLVYPVDADISAGRISVLTPIGTALIGLSQGQSITWTARNGQRHVLTVLD